MDGSRWRASPRLLARLLLGLGVFGAGEGLIVVADLGNSPWTVLAQGAARSAPIGIGLMTIAISFVILLAWIPLRQQPGLGTVLNAVVVGLALGAVDAVLAEPGSLIARYVLMVVGIGLIALGSGIYLTCFLGPGPRDGLMAGLHRRLGISVRVARVAIELCALAVGLLLGGTAGIGTVAFALLIGPLVQVALRVLGAGRPATDI